MITVGFCTRKNDGQYTTHLKDKSYWDSEIICIENDGTRSLTSCYNEILDRAVNDIVLLIHDDLILPKSFDKTLYEHFQSSDYGILGVAGTNELNENCVWWHKKNLMTGSVWHISQGKEHQSKYSPPNDIINEVAVIDGLFIGVHKKRIESRFNEKINGFHFYDISFCLDNKTVKKGVFFYSKLVHKSVGQVNEGWHENRVIVSEMYKDMLPYRVVPQIHIPQFDKKTSDDDSVAVIIPSKNNFSYLRRCVDSIIKHTQHSNYKIFYADTGSYSSDIDSFEKDYPQVKVIRYDYYHYGKINNDVVRNHCDKFRYLLFCNDDIIFLNDVISQMLHVHTSQKNVGTTGARLYYENNTIQHAGIRTFIDNRGMLNISHDGLGTYHNFSLKNEKKIGNTAALLMIKKTNFTRVKGFIENNEECFEDVILNLRMIDIKLENIFVGSAVAYHTESVSRKKDKEKSNKEIRDYINFLLPLIKKKFNIYKKYI